MGPFEIIYCSQYYELKKNGRDPMKGRLNGTILSAVMLMLVVAALVIVFTYFVPHNPISEFFRSTINRRGSGRSTGKFVGLLCTAALGFIVWLTIGSKKNYEQMIEGWQQLPDEVLKKTIKQSLFLFLASFAIFLGSMFFLF